MKLSKSFHKFRIDCNIDVVDKKTVFAAYTANTFFFLFLIRYFIRLLIFFGLSFVYGNKTFFFLKIRHFGGPIKRGNFPKTSRAYTRRLGTPD